MAVSDLFNLESGSVSFTVKTYRHFVQIVKITGNLRESGLILWLATRFRFVHSLLSHKHCDIGMSLLVGRLISIYASWHSMLFVRNRVGVFNHAELTLLRLPVPPD
jgi:hypothetical protein